MSKTVEIHYGALADPIEKQVQAQGFTLDEDALKLQKLYDSMIMCWVHGLVTDSQKDAMMQKMQKKIISALKKIEEVDE